MPTQAIVASAIATAKMIPAIVPLLSPARLLDLAIISSRKFAVTWERRR